ncbi:TolC family protein [Pedobacter panaciterrae]
MAKLEAEDFRLTLATEVKKRYYAYIQQINQLKIYTQSVQDNQNVADNLKNKFEKGEVALDTYNQSRINLTIASTSKIQTEVNLLSAKDALEEIIGMKLSEVK